jgi:molybdopterin biosynthesis enzyme MoaB
VTPEAVMKVIDKRADSLVHYLQTEALKISPMTCLSRTLIGMMSKGDKQVMVITLPGKPKAISENMGILMSKNVLKHAI